MTVDVRETQLPRLRLLELLLLELDLEARLALDREEDLDLLAVAREDELDRELVA